MVAAADETLMQHNRALFMLAGFFVFGVLRETPPFSSAAFATVVAGGMLGIAWAGGRAAMEALTAPITVSCPECGGDYLLQGYGESPDGGRQETDTWIKANTRPCPACGSPIEKMGGCNAMVCTACRSPFCWACMRAKSACGHTRCANGAPFGDYRDARGAFGQPAGDTPAARADALVGRAGILAVVVLCVGCGALISGVYGAERFSAVRASPFLVIL